MPINAIKEEILRHGPFNGLIKSVTNYVPMQRNAKGVCEQLATCEIEVEVAGNDDAESMVLNAIAAPTDDTLPQPGQVWNFTIHEQCNPAGHPRMSLT